MVRPTSAFIDRKNQKGSYFDAAFSSDDSEDDSQFLAHQTRSAPTTRPSTAKITKTKPSLKTITRKGYSKGDAHSVQSAWSNGSQSNVKKPQWNDRFFMREDEEFEEMGGSSDTIPTMGSILNQSNSIQSKRSKSAAKNLKNTLASIQSEFAIQSALYSTNIAVSSAEELTKPISTHPILKEKRRLKDVAKRNKSSGRTTIRSSSRPTSAIHKGKSKISKKRNAINAPSGMNHKKNLEKLN